MDSGTFAYGRAPEDDLCSLQMHALSRNPRPRRADSKARPLLLSIAGCVIRIVCGSPELFDLLLKAYGAIRCRNAARGDINYIVRRSGGPSSYRILRPGRRALRAADNGEFIFRFEKELTIELQRRRRDLYFLHAAALEFDGKGILLVATS